MRSLRCLHKDARELLSRTHRSAMFQLLLLAALLAAYVLLTQTLFKRCTCRGNAAVAGRTAVITGEPHSSVPVVKETRHVTVVKFDCFHGDRCF